MKNKLNYAMMCAALLLTPVFCRDSLASPLVKVWQSRKVCPKFFNFVFKSVLIIYIVDHLCFFIVYYRLWCFSISIGRITLTSSSRLLCLVVLSFSGAPRKVKGYLYKGRNYNLAQFEAQGNKPKEINDSFLNVDAIAFISFSMPRSEVRILIYRRFPIGSGGTPL